MKFKSKDYLLISQETQDVQSVVNMLSGIIGYNIQQRNPGWPDMTIKTKKDLERIFTFIQIHENEMRLIKGSSSWKRLFNK